MVVITLIIFHEIDKTYFNIPNCNFNCYSRCFLLFFLWSKWHIE